MLTFVTKKKKRFQKFFIHLFCVCAWGGGDHLLSLQTKKQYMIFKKLGFILFIYIYFFFQIKTKYGFPGTFDIFGTFGIFLSCTVHEEICTHT